MLTVFFLVSKPSGKRLTNVDVQGGPLGDVELHLVCFVSHNVFTQITVSIHQKRLIQANLKQYPRGSWLFFLLY